MQTPSHLLINAALLPRLRRFSVRKGAFLLGSVAPDLPLFALFFGATFYFTQVLEWDRSRTFHHIFDDLYFYDPYWIAAHNLLHSPISLSIGFVAIALLQRLAGLKLVWLFWFLVSCSIHSFIDIFTHFDDGPLVFFPLEWETRFQSPISYWDSNHFGREFTAFELSLDVALICYLSFLGALTLYRRWSGNSAQQEVVPQPVSCPSETGGE